MNRLLSLPPELLVYLLETVQRSCSEVVVLFSWPEANRYYRDGWFAIQTMLRLRRVCRQLYSIITDRYGSELEYIKESTLRLIAARKKGYLNISPLPLRLLKQVDPDNPRRPMPRVLRDENYYTDIVLD